MARIETFRSPGYGELHQARCLDCGWQSHPIDAVLNQAAWNRARGHRCAQDDYDDQE